jgi:hypothetical protein
MTEWLGQTVLIDNRPFLKAEVVEGRESSEYQVD